MRHASEHSIEKPGAKSGSEFDTTSADFAPPVTATQALEVRQVAGTHAGGSFALSQGSFRVGPGEASAALESGKTASPRFGLTVAPDGTTQLIPPAGGITVDGRPVTSPVALEPGQIIDATSARFQIGIARDRDALQAEATDELTSPSLSPMPAASKKRGVDNDVMDWLHSVQAEMARSMRTGFTPDEIKRRSVIGPSSFRIAPVGSTLFGRAPVALGDLGLNLPGDLSLVNKQTRTAVGASSIVPSVPLDVDLLTQSIAIVGQTSSAQTIASWLTLCVSVLASPDDVGVTILARNNRGDWSWCDALPHAEQRPGRALNIIINDRQTDLGRLPTNGVISIVDNHGDIPDDTEIVLDLSGADPTLQDTTTGRCIDGVTPIGVSSVFAYDVTFAMAEHFLPPTGVQR